MKAFAIFVILLFAAPSALASNAFVQISQVEMTQDTVDMRLAGKIRSTIAFEPRLASAKVVVTVRENTIFFSGFINSAKEKNALLTIARQMAGDKVFVSLDRLTFAQNSVTSEPKVHAF